MKLSRVTRPMKTNNLSAFQAVRKPMPQASQVMGEGKRKNAYRRKEKHKVDFRYETL